MDFLKICRELREEAGISGSGPAKTTDQTGILSRIVYAVRDAWTRIQDDPHDWKWMWKRDGSVETLGNVDEYVVEQDFESIHAKSCKIYLKAKGVSDISRVSLIDWDEYDRRYGALQNKTPSRPNVITVMPNGDIKVYPLPNDVYTITFDYQKNAQILVESADEPEMPERYHQLIKFEAMKVFAGTDDAPELVLPADYIINNLWRDLHWKQRLKTTSQMVVVPE